MQEQIEDTAANALHNLKRDSCVCEAIALASLNRANDIMSSLDEESEHEDRGDEVMAHRTLKQQRLREATIKAARTARMQKRYGMSSSSLLKHFNINISRILRGDRRRK